MTKNKKLLFFTLLLAIACILFFRFTAKETYSDFNRTAKDNPARSTTVMSGETYPVDNVRFKPGYYDLTVTSGQITIQSVRLEKGDHFVGVSFYGGNKVNVSGKGTASLAPAQFKKLPLVNHRYLIRHQSGYYQAGKEIEAGNYQLKVTNKKGTPFYLFVQVTDPKSANGGRSFDLSHKKSTASFALKKGQILELLNWSKESTDLTLSLTLQHD
ncbi:hypothetical protein [Sporolactobacillus terrae]|uniref:hypothetical protein n=1 Tax=Sporolactobacillus terrae TaxID=269673 RepID=UPI00048F65EC|nr:hypothetical protein [Sporolactobacillus terrae]